MRQGRFARSGWIAFLVVCIATLGLVAAASSAGAAPHPEPVVSSVTPVILHACPSTNGLKTAWGYNNTATGNVTITQPDNNDDPRTAGHFGDGDNDDNFFVPAPDTRPGQPNTFLPGAHGTDAAPIVTTDEPAPTTWVTGVPYVTSSAPLNCADVQVTKSQLIGTVTAGQQNQYTVTATNAGPTAATGVAVSDALPSGATNVTATSGQTTCTVASGAVSCAAVPSLALSASITVTITVTLPSTGSLSDTASATTTSFDPNTANNTASVNTTVAAVGGSQGGGILNQGQQLTVTDPAINGTIKVTSGTLALTTDVAPCPTNIPTISCKSEALNMEPHGVPNGQIVTEVFDSGRPSPFIPIWLVKFFYFKSDNIDHPMPLCPHYLVPNPGPSGNVCEYFRYMNLQGHAIVFLAVGANDARSHR
jgi:uncharacterized repeat protein (TIGR01451 family)